MINEEKVKQLYKVALCEQKEEKVHRQIGKYYRSDYIAKEMLKSIFTGTLAYLFMSALWLIKNWKEVLDQINRMEFVQTLIPFVVIYVVFMMIYIASTYAVYKEKYEDFHRQIDAYEAELKILDQMYEREEKLKA